MERTFERGLDADGETTALGDSAGGVLTRTLPLPESVTPRRYPCDPNEAMQRDDHEVTEDTLGAHSHDHTHAATHAPAGPHAGHVHWHRHLEDRQADAELNGHTHALRPRRLPWEANENEN
jgi:hypothetical protein